MSGNDWVTACMAKARERHGQVPSTVADKLEMLLQGPLSERELPRGGLTDIARVLILGISSVQKEAEPRP